VRSLCVSASYEQLMDAYLKKWRAEADAIRKSLEFQAFSDALEERRESLDMPIQQNDWISLLKTLPRRGPLNWLRQPSGGTWRTFAADDCVARCASEAVSTWTVAPRAWLGATTMG
jgi:hypothetical protein